MKRDLGLPEQSTVNVEAEIRAIIADVLCIDQSIIQPTSHIRNDLGADSLDLVTLIIAVSGRFDVQICDGEVLNIQTVGEAVAYLEQAQSTSRVHS